MNIRSADKQVFDFVLHNVRRLIGSSVDGISVLPTAGYTVYDEDPDLYRFPEFYDQFMVALLESGDDGWSLLVLRPDPYLYYYNRFGELPLVTNDAVKSSDEYISAIHRGPNGSLADAIAVRAEAVVWCSGQGSRLYVFDQEAERAYRLCSLNPQPFFAERM